MRSKEHPASGAPARQRRATASLNAQQRVRGARPRKASGGGLQVFRVLRLKVLGEVRFQAVGRLPSAAVKGAERAGPDCSVLQLNIFGARRERRLEPELQRQLRHRVL